MSAIRQIFTPALTVAAVAALCVVVLADRMHRNAMENSGVQIAHCVDTGRAAGAVYVGPVLVAWRCRESL